MEQRHISPSVESLEARSFLSVTSTTDDPPVVVGNFVFAALDGRRGDELFRRERDGGGRFQRVRIPGPVVHLSAHRGALVVATGGPGAALYRIDARGRLRRVRPLDVSLGMVARDPAVVARVGDELFFSVSSPTAGDSLWRVPLSGNAAPTVVRHFGGRRIGDGFVAGGGLVVSVGHGEGSGDRFFISSGGGVRPILDGRGASPDGRDDGVRPDDGVLPDRDDGVLPDFGKTGRTQVGGPVLRTSFGDD